MRRIVGQRFPFRIAVYLWHLECLDRLIDGYVNLSAAVFGRLLVGETTMIDSNVINIGVVLL